MYLIDSIVKKRFPDKTELRLVFGVIVFLVFSWAIWKFLYDLPAQLLSTYWTDIILHFLTLMATALIESVITAIGILFLSLLLPVKWFRDGFLYKSFVTLILLTGLIMWIRRVFVHDDYFPPINVLYIGGIIFFIGWVFLLVLFHYVKPLQRFVHFIEDQIEVFLWLYIPLGIIGFFALLLASVMSYG
jgi:hypothetical protein